MADSTVRRGGTGKDRTQFGAHTRAEAGAGLGGDQGAPQAAPEVPAARVEYDKARNARTTADELAVLAESKSDVVRLEVAQNPNASPDTLRDLAASDEDLVRDIARQNPAYEPGTVGERLGIAVTRLRRGEQPSRLIEG
jgi:hypothetical protein